MADQTYPVMTRFSKDERARVRAAATRNKLRQQGFTYNVIMAAVEADEAERGPSSCEAPCAPPTPPSEDSCDEPLELGAADPSESRPDCSGDY